MADGQHEHLRKGRCHHRRQQWSGRGDGAIPRRPRRDRRIGRPARRSPPDVSRRDHTKGRQGVRACHRRDPRGAGSSARRRRGRAVRPYRRDPQQCGRNATLAAGAPEDRRLGPHHRHQHQRRAVRDCRGAAPHAAAEVGPLHQRLVGCRSQGRPGECRVCGNEDRCARHLRRIAAGRSSPGTFARRSSRRARSRPSCRRASPRRTSREGSASSYEQYAIPAESFARAVAFAISQPGSCRSRTSTKFVSGSTRQNLGACR